MFSKILIRARSSSLIQGLFLLTSGSVIAQIIGVLAAPLLSRLYTPEQFGVLGTILAVSFVISTISSFQYEMAIVLEKDDAKVQALQRLCLFLLSLVTGISTVILLAASFWLVYMGNNSEFVRYLPWAIPIAFFTGLFNIYIFRLTREKAYKTSSLSLIGRRLSTVLFQLILGLLGAKALGLILGNVIGCIVALGIVILLERSLFTSGYELISIKQVAKTYYRFAYYTAPQKLLNMVSNQLPIFMLGHYYSGDTVGAYFFAMRILQLPATFIGEAIRRTFYIEATGLLDNIPKLRRIYLKITGALAATIIIPVIILFIWGPELFAFVFGDNWREAGDYSRWMFLWVGMAFVNPPSVMLYNVLNMQRCALVIDGLLFLLRYLSLLFGGLFFADATNTIIVYSLVGLLINGLIIIIVILKLNALTKIKMS